MTPSLRMESERDCIPRKIVADGLFAVSVDDESRVEDEGDTDGVQSAGLTGVADLGAVVSGGGGVGRNAASVGGAPRGGVEGGGGPGDAGLGNIGVLPLGVVGLLKDG